MDEFIAQNLEKIILRNNPELNSEEIFSEISDLKLFTKLKLQGLLDPKSKIDLVHSEFNYDILNWIDNLGKKTI